MSIHAKRAALVIAVLLAFTIYATVRLIRMIVSGHAGSLMVGFVALFALQWVVILVAVLSVVRMLYRRPSRQPPSPAPRL